MRFFHHSLSSRRSPLFGRPEWQDSLVPDILSAVPLKDQSARALKVTGWSERVQKWVICSLKSKHQSSWLLFEQVRSSNPQQYSPWHILMGGITTCKINFHSPLPNANLPGLEKHYCVPSLGPGSTVGKRAGIKTARLASLADFCGAWSQATVFQLKWITFTPRCVKTRTAYPVLAKYWPSLLLNSQ